MVGLLYFDVRRGMSWPIKEGNLSKASVGSRSLEAFVRSRSVGGPKSKDMVPEVCASFSMLLGMSLSVLFGRPFIRAPLVGGVVRYVGVRYAGVHHGVVHGLPKSGAEVHN